MHIHTKQEIIDRKIKTNMQISTTTGSLAKRGLLVATAALALAMALLIANFLGMNKKVTYNDSQCELLPDIEPGSEDIAVVDKNLALVSSGDLKRVFFKSGGPRRDTGIFAIHFIDNDSGTETIHTEKIPIIGFPEGETFNPNGISYSKKTQRVYATSHDCGDHVSEGIEIFHLVRGEGVCEGGSEEVGEKCLVTPSVKLVYERSVRSNSFPLGAMNAVVEGAFLGELYVTQWLPRAMSDQCIGNGGFITEMKMTLDMFFSKKTNVHRCVWDPEQLVKAATCDVVATGFHIANGITSDPDRKLIFVVDAGDDKLYVFDRSEDGSLSLKATVDLPHAGDNIEFDVASNKLTLGSMPYAYQVLAKMNWASKKGHVHVAKELLEHGAEIEAKDNDGYTPLHCACCRDHFAVVIELLGHGAESDAKKSNGSTTSILGKRMSRGGANIEAKTDHGNTPLHLAGGVGHLVIVKALLSGGADILAANIAGRLPIHIAVDTGKSATSKYLLQHFYATTRPLPLHELLEDVTWIGNPKSEDAPPLRYALDHNVLGTDDVVEIIEYLVDRDPALLRSRDPDGSLPLHVACRRGVSFNTVQSLVDLYEACVKSLTPQGDLPLFLACEIPEPSLDTIFILMKLYPDLVYR
jgi:ankyrin repeat protein